MKLYRFSPIKNQEDLLAAIQHIHRESYKLCNQAFGYYLPNAGNIGVFCHYNEEYELLTNIRKELTEESDNLNQKYYRLHHPIIIPASDSIPETIYTHLYIRRPDPYRAHVGDIDFYLPTDEYVRLRASIAAGEHLKSARVFDRQDLDMIELFDPDIDVLAYVSTEKMTNTVRVKQSKVTNL